METLREKRKQHKKLRQVLTVIRGVSLCMYVHIRMYCAYTYVLYIYILVL